jgi:hypothetical protein
MLIHKLGKKPAKHDPRTLQFKNYLAAKPTALPPTPDEVSWVTKVPSWPMMMNDSLGDCTIAAAGHMIQQWSFFANVEVTPTDQQVLQAYEAVSGYVPGEPWTDNGAVILDVLNYWRQHGIAGHKITAYTQVDHSNLDEIRAAIQLFGNVYIGIQLPVTAQTQDAWTVANGGTFTQDGQPGSWGGHAIPLMAQSPKTQTCITWGERLKMSHNFFLDYCDEAYAIVSQDWIGANGLSPSQFNLKQLMLDLAAVNQLGPGKTPA